MSDSFPSRAQVEHLKRSYPPGTRVELTHMADPYAPVPPSTKGIVQVVDDAGQLHVAWDNGRTLALIPGEDEFRRLPEQQMGGMQL